MNYRRQVLARSQTRGLLVVLLLASVGCARPIAQDAANRISLSASEAPTPAISAKIRNLVLEPEHLEIHVDVSLSGVDVQSDVRPIKIEDRLYGIDPAEVYVDEASTPPTIIVSTCFNSISRVPASKASSFNVPAPSTLSIPEEGCSVEVRISSVFYDSSALLMRTLFDQSEWAIVVVIGYANGRFEPPGPEDYIRRFDSKLRTWQKWTCTPPALIHSVLPDR